MNKFNLSEKIEAEDITRLELKLFQGEMNLDALLTVFHQDIM